MKRLLITLILLTALFCSSAVAAQNEKAIAQEVLSLCEDVFPGYRVLTKDGYDDGTNGQWALVLT